MSSVIVLHLHQLLVWFLAIFFCCDVCPSFRFASCCTGSIRSCCANTSDPISNTSPVATVTVPDTDTASDNHFAVAEQSIAALQRKRYGTEMSVTGAVPGTPARNDLGYNRNERGCGS